jgi:hypothetical protein
LLAAATTYGSSVAIGTSTSRPLIVKLQAMPIGTPQDAGNVLDHVIGLIER